MDAVDYDLQDKEGEEAAGIPGAFGELGAVFEVAVEGLGRLVGQKGMKGVLVKRGAVVGWKGVKLIERQRFKRGVARAVIADGEFHDGLLQVAALALHRHGPEGEAPVVRLTIGGGERAVGCGQGLHLLQQSANKWLLQSEQGESRLSRFCPVATDGRFGRFLADLVRAL